MKELAESDLAKKEWSAINRGNAKSRLRRQVRLKQLAAAEAITRALLNVERTLHSSSI